MASEIFAPIDVPERKKVVLRERILFFHMQGVYTFLQFQLQSQSFSFQ
jgi:hypothetical protein